MNTGDDFPQQDQSSYGPSGLRMVGQDAANPPDCLLTTPLAWRRRLVVPSRAQAGMRLMEDVTLRNGTKLLPTGTVLDVQTLQRLIQRQIDIIVVATPDERTPEQLEADVEAVMMRLDHIFRGPSTSVRDLLKMAVMTHALASVMPCTPAN